MRKNKSLPYVITAAIIIILIGLLVFLLFDSQSKKDEAAAEETRQSQSEEKTKQDIKSYTQKTKLDTCLRQADDAYWEFAKLNAAETKQSGNGSIYSMPESSWERADTIKKQATDECYRRYGA